MYNIMKSILDEGVRLSQAFNVTNVKTAVFNATTTRTPTPPRESGSLDQGIQPQGYDINTAKSLAYERLSDGEKPTYAKVSHLNKGEMISGYGDLDAELYSEGFQFPLDVDAEYVIGQNNGSHLPKEESFL